VDVRSGLREVDPQRPNASRIYDYFLGGTHNFAADRQAAQALLAAMPELPAAMRANRDFLRRAVEAAAADGVRQFLDLGSGIPTEATPTEGVAAGGNVHEIARRTHPRARVVYVDLEPVAVVHGRRLLDGDPDADVVLADLTDAEAVLGDPAVHRLLDLSRPVCLLAVAVAHFVADTERLGLALEHYREALAPGSWLVLSHAGGAGDRQHAESARRIYNSTTSSLVLRDRDDVRPLFGDWPLVEPGLTTGGRWRPDDGVDAPDDVAGRSITVGAARKG
jgi:S-adenosyl methyltransferase